MRECLAIADCRTYRRGDFAGLIPGDHGVRVVSTLRADASIRSSVVNAGVPDHPVTGESVVGSLRVVAAASSFDLKKS